MTDLDAIRERHHLREEAGTGDWNCVFDAQPWPCDAVQLLARVDDLDAIRERHRPHRDEDGTFCLADSQDWGEHGCDAHQAIARVAELEAALKLDADRLRIALMQHFAYHTNSHHDAACANLIAEAALSRPVSDFGIQVVIGPEPKP